MAGQQHDEQILIELSDLLHHLVTANGRHQEVQQHNIVGAVANTLDRLQRIVFHINRIAGSAKIILDRSGDNGIIVQC